MKNKKEKFAAITLFAIIVALLGGMGWQRIQFYRALKALAGINSKTVTLFRIYSRGGSNSIEFEMPDPIIDDFFQAVVDFRSYWSRSGGVVSDDLVWFMEITPRGKNLIQIDCAVPADEDNIVIGGLDKLTQNGLHLHYGRFQSRQLYRWYQAYSHRWLNPNEPPLKQAK